jgi:uncharacterized membrane protein
MELFLTELETYMYNIVEVCTSLLEFFGIVVLVTSAVRSFVRWARRDRKNIRLDLAQGIALALEFKMGGEVLRTVVVREWSELGILGAIIVLRAMLTFLIHWEIKNEKKDMAENTPPAPAEEASDRDNFAGTV